MNNDKITELIKQLDGISYSEWFKLNYLVETYFSQKKHELEREIKLSSENALLSAEATLLLSRKN